MAEKNTKTAVSEGEKIKRTKKYREIKASLIDQIERSGNGSISKRRYARPTSRREESRSWGSDPRAARSPRKMTAPTSSSAPINRCSDSSTQ